MKLFIKNLWEKSSDISKLSILEKFNFFILCFLEKLYCLSFFIVLFLKKNKKKKSFPFKIISIGNLSVGGTGKSVFVQFLIKKILNFNGAIVLRGYKGKGEKLKKSFLVSNGNEVLLSPSFCGDEAFMLSTSLNVPIVIGKNRLKSCLLLEDQYYDLNNNNKLDYVVLDDAYQNFDLNKDFDILLIDAREPFSNGHCLPAGKLREKDYCRANAIILTHSDLISESKIESIKNILIKKFNKNLIFTGKHNPTSILLLGKKEIEIEKLRNNKFLAFAGIASFSSFLNSLKEINLNIFETIRYSDHYNYSKKDIIKFLKILKNNEVDAIITTKKDWVKILPLLKHYKNWQNLPIYVLNIEFQFLSRLEEIAFLQLIEKLLK